MKIVLIVFCVIKSFYNMYKDNPRKQYKEERKREYERAPQVIRRIKEWKGVSDD